MNPSGSHCCTWRTIAAITLLATVGIFALAGAYVGYQSNAYADEDGLIWHTNFEEWQPFSQWQKGEKDNNAKTVLFPGPFGSNANNRVLQLRVSPGKGASGINRQLAKGYQKLYLRWFILYESGFDFTAQMHGQGLQANVKWGKPGYRPKGNDRFSAKVDHGINLANGLPSPFIYAYYPGMSMDCQDPDGRCWGDHLPCFIDQRRYCRDPAYHPISNLPHLTSNQWYCIELMVDLGSPTSSAAQANGSMNLTIDNQALGPWQNLWLRSDGKLELNRVIMGLYHHGHHSEAGILIDEIKLSEQPIGCSL
ncbi:hypothetical protein DU002_13685 [Corallincola holothuriorum]|uniref:Uncharacterized protein n=1 Tax=Corallincola holothuriorum TaxID=2282215 RepID=A0A368NHE9_9GAMM|nr:hypothetical protein [Corallincola holothuriorum]RCU48829.1 hypothetical protein DU002_13685 [Corallincola holothuriorum]